MNSFTLDGIHESSITMDKSHLRFSRVHNKSDHVGGIPVFLPVRDGNDMDSGSYDIGRSCHTSRLDTFQIHL